MMNKREAFRRALTDNKHRKHMRKSGKHWLVRGVTAVTLGLMMAQPVVSVAAVIDAEPQTEVPASEAPVTEDAPAAETVAPEEAPVDETLSKPAPNPGEEVVKEAVTPEVDSQPAPDAEQDLAATEPPAKDEFQEGNAEEEIVGPEQERASVTVGDLDIIYGDNIPTVRINYIHQDGAAGADDLDLADLVITDEDGNLTDQSAPIDVGEYQLEVKPEVLASYGLNPDETEIHFGRLTVAPKLAELHLDDQAVQHGQGFGALSFSLLGILPEDVDSVKIGLADGIVMEELPIGRHQLNVELQSENGKHVNYMLDHPGFELTVRPNDGDVTLMVGGDKTYDGTAELPDNLISGSNLVVDGVSQSDLEFSTPDSDIWESQPPTNAGGYEVRVNENKRLEIQQMLSDTYDIWLDDADFQGNYNINSKEITDSPAFIGDYYLRVPTGKQFDGTPKFKDKLDYHLSLGYELSEEHFMYRPVQAGDDELLPFASRAALGWQEGTPTAVGEYQLILRDDVVSDINMTSRNHVLSQSPSTYVITAAGDNSTSPGDSAGSGSGGSGGTTAPNSDSIAYVSQTSGHTLPLAMTNSQADGTLPSTGQRNQTLLSMLGMTLLGTLGLAGWYKRHQAK